MIVVFTDAEVASSSASDTAAATAVGVEGAAEGREVHVSGAGGEEDGEDVLEQVVELVLLPNKFRGNVKRVERSVSERCI